VQSQALQRFFFVTFYLIGDMPWSSLGPALLPISANLWAFEGIAQLFSLTPNVLLGMMNFMFIWFVGFLFLGLFVRIPDVIRPFQLVCYMMPIGYTSQTFM
jgi:glucan phosphoethanolaminetransferase (alkaline phosphatase superfamily)